MGKLAPKIDGRTAEDIAAQVQELLEQYTGENKPIQGTRAALVNIFARFSEIIIERLNQVPDKNFLAFLDLLGASRLPPQPARVPLTFLLAAGTTVDAVVPKRTQVAAPPAEGEKDPVIFETERELVVSAAKLESIFVRDPQQDLYTESSSILTTPELLGVPIFRGNQAIEHILYIGHSKLLGFPKIESLKFKINLSKALGEGGEIKWQILQETEDEANWEEITPRNDGTQGFTQSGENREIEFTNINAVPLTTVNSVTNRWLRCRLLTPISLADESATDMVSASELPEIEDIKLEARISSIDLLIETAFTNQLPVDVTKDFFPFGEKPKFGDTFYLANNQAFSQQNADITIQINLTNPASEDNEEEFVKPTKASKNLKLKWEFWNGKQWKELTTAEEEAGFEDTTRAFTQKGHVKFNLFEKPYPTTVNGIKDFWIRVRIISGNYGREVRYQNIATSATEPSLARESIRESSLARESQGYRFIEATFAPPLIDSITVNYTLTKQEKPEIILTYNDTVYSDNLIQRIDNQNQVFPKPLIPFQKTETDKPACYFGFTLPPGRTYFPNRTISLFNSMADVKYGEKLVPLSPTKSRIIGAANSTVTHKFWLTNNTSESVQFELTILGMNWDTNVEDSLEVEADSVQEVEVSVEIPDEAELDSSDRGFLEVRQVNNSSIIYNARFETFVGQELPKNEQLKLSWQYWNGKKWGNLIVRDETENFTRPGLIEFLPPSDFALRKDFNLSPRYWLRVQWLSGEYEVEPRLKRVLLNTTMAVQTLTIQKEILGSSDGNENQKFQTTKQPILAGQQLEVREREIPSIQEQQKIVFEEGEDAITSITDATGRPKEIWVRWHQVKDFYQSEARDRHYVLDNLTGKITFGDGRNGLIPPPGRGNIRMNRYQTGGGKAGNKAVGSIVQLKTTVPYVDKVINHQAAAGGAEAETLNSLIERAPREIRHRQRAVTLEDYEDLAKLASPEVIRAKCIPLTNLKVNPLDTRELLGAVSVIIVPRSTEAKPLPSLELINRVQDYLETHASPTVNISVVGPLYVRVSITVEIALISLEGGGQVAQAVEQKLASFLHPLTGGFEGMGWDFGREPYKSDFYRLLEGIAGVDHIRNLEVDEMEELTGAKQTGRFLVYSGNHEISLTFVES
ncbi:putative baseplate assembly protein [Okeania hirsuta]|uniref:Putative baseplate assembly protein n=1 Tax=Okeania hirsuta TaxID=1458930 RepID=A0A3N6PJ74_9CYAN|nr:putative baseplate assembly protein [Okeania hirsuta]RQH53447.1 putative baseplate assembly protein [Okeania hirsuta]